MDVHAKVSEIRQVVEEARSMPMSASVVVNRVELLDQLDELATQVRKALEDAEGVISRRDGLLESARTEAAEILARARAERESVVSDTEVFRLAKRRADEVLTSARTETDELRQETDDYVDSTLANFEITLERTAEAVKRGRERLAGRSTLDSLTTDEADKIVLPDHLEG